MVYRIDGDNQNDLGNEEEEDNVLRQFRLDEEAEMREKRERIIGRVGYARHNRLLKLHEIINDLEDLGVSGFRGDFFYLNQEIINLQVYVLTRKNTIQNEQIQCALKDIKSSLNIIHQKFSTNVVEDKISDLDIHDFVCKMRNFFKKYNSYFYEFDLGLTSRNDDLEK